jgi:hypothetical protein
MVHHSLYSPLLLLCFVFFKELRDNVLLFYITVYFFFYLTSSAKYSPPNSSKQVQDLYTQPPLSSASLCSPFPYYLPAIRSVI